MDIRCSRTLAELKLSREGLWNDMSDTFVWIVYSFLLIIASFILESSVSIAPGNFKATLGGPASWLGLAGASGLCIHRNRKRNAANKIVWRCAQAQDEAFYHFRDNGCEYGVRNVWTHYLSWELITRIDFKSHSIDLEYPAGQLTVRTNTLKEEEWEELKTFIAKQRDEILPEPFFGYRRSTTGRESYSTVKNLQSKKGGDGYGDS